MPDTSDPVFARLATKIRRLNVDAAGVLELLVDELDRRQTVRASTPIGPIVMTVRMDGSILKFQDTAASTTESPLQGLVSAGNLDRADVCWGHHLSKIREAISRQKTLDDSFIIRDEHGVPRNLKAEITPRGPDRATTLLRETAESGAAEEHPLLAFAYDIVGRMTGCVAFATAATMMMN